MQLCRAAGSPCPVLKAPYWPQNFSSQKASRPFFYILPHLDVPPAADTERENRNASDQPRKEPKGGFFSTKNQVQRKLVRRQGWLMEQLLPEARHSHSPKVRAEIALEFPEEPPRCSATMPKSSSFSRQLHKTPLLGCLELILQLGEGKKKNLI